jgi:hypothetical protein
MGMTGQDIYDNFHLHARGDTAPQRQADAFGRYQRPAGTTAECVVNGGTASVGQARRTPYR